MQTVRSHSCFPSHGPRNHHGSLYVTMRSASPTKHPKGTNAMSRPSHATRLLNSFRLREVLREFVRARVAHSVRDSRWRLGSEQSQTGDCRFERFPFAFPSSDARNLRLMDWRESSQTPELNREWTLINANSRQRLGAPYGGLPFPCMRTSASKRGRVHHRCRRQVVAELTSG